MSEALFKVGSVYRGRSGAIRHIVELAPEFGFAIVAIDGGDGQPGTRFSNPFRLSDGRYAGGLDHDDDYMHLVPGELTLVNDAWVATPTLDKMEAEKEEPRQSEWDAEDGHKRDAEAWREWEKVKAEIEAADAAMIARDNTPAARLQAETRLYLDQVEAMLAATLPSTAKPANEALTRLSAQGHRLGMGR